MYGYEITDIQFKFEFSVFAFLNFFLYCWVSVPNEAVNSGKGLYCSHHLTETSYLPHFCHSCSAKYHWRKTDRRKFSSIYFYFLPMFSSYVFLPPSNLNNAHYLVCLFFPPICFLGAEKAEFRSFPYLYRFYIFWLKKPGSLTRRNSVSRNSLSCFYRFPLGQEAFSKEIEQMGSFQVLTRK